MTKLRVGDRVGVTKRDGDGIGYSDNNYMEAVVVKFHPADDDPCVEFDEPMGGHDCEGKAMDDHGWYLTLGDDLSRGIHSVEVLKKGKKVKKKTRNPKFKKGQRVRVVNHYTNTNDMLGTVKGKRIDSSSFCVELDQPHPEGGHDCFDSCEGGCVAKKGHGWYFNPNNLEKTTAKKKKVKPANFCQVLSEL